MLRHQAKLKHHLTKSSEDDETQSSSSEVESTTTSVPVKSEMPTSSDDAYALMVQGRNLYKTLPILDPHI